MGCGVERDGVWARSNAGSPPSQNPSSSQGRRACCALGVMKVPGAMLMLASYGLAQGRARFALRARGRRRRGGLMDGPRAIERCVSNAKRPLLWYRRRHEAEGDGGGV